jgi:hypothetical protein
MISIMPQIRPARGKSSAPGATRADRAKRPDQRRNPQAYTAATRLEHE